MYENMNETKYMKCMLQFRTLVSLSYWYLFPNVNKDK